ncbi:MAG: hypothetical protein Q4A07_11825, partial [Coriobacteriales bacterium]|nr:hypothetical protein [Coriobacteriales bacterium]
MDFLVQEGNVVIPVEVKSGEVVRSASLRYYARKYPEETPLRLRLSMRNLSCDDGLLNVPLYMAEHALRLAKPILGKSRLAKRDSSRN